jgi:hypothetical protein
MAFVISLIVGRCRFILASTEISKEFTTVCLYTIYEASVHGFSVHCAKQYGGYISIQNDMVHCPLFFIVISDDVDCPVW